MFKRFISTRTGLEDVAAIDYVSLNISSALIFELRYKKGEFLHHGHQYCKKGTARRNFGGASILSGSFRAFN